VEIIVAHLIYDLPTLKACAAVCLSWYNIATPHLHHTLIFREQTAATSDKDLHKYLSPLAPLHKLRLLSFVKQVQFRRATSLHSRVTPLLFDPRSMRYFRTLVNLQDLAIADLDFSMFPVGVDQYFGHFSPTLRSVTLSCPRGTPRQLLDFLRLFPKLNDIRIAHYYPKSQDGEGVDTQLVPIEGEPRCRLVLRWSGDMQFLLEACAETLETLRVRPDTTPQDRERILPSVSSMFQLMLLLQSPLNFTSTYHTTLSLDPWNFRRPPSSHQRTLVRSGSSFPQSRLQCFPRSLSYSPTEIYAVHPRSWLGHYARCTKSGNLGWSFVWRHQRSQEWIVCMR
jgi:hypothetical protein